ncbi:MAG: PAS domain S-box protein [Pontiellaceae bacterium]|nr:PAS domain S-box protein [Pontiellaceae bacterium]MBN2783269.1 PAS domain S-box protein [Pontiellaceae bacterium]
MKPFPAKTEGRFENLRKDGSLYTEKASITPIFDDEGNITHYVAVKRNITQELRLEEQYRQAQKMEAVGQLASGVAHDFNDVLQTILGFSALLMTELQDRPELCSDIEEIKKAAKNGSRLTKQLLSFSRKQSTEYAPQQLNDLIHEESKMLKRLLGRNIQFELQLESALYTIQTDRIQMTQVVMNLCVNARDAMSNGGTLSIATKNYDFDANTVADIAQARPGRFVCLSVSDTGIGIPKEIQSRLFEPFYTTKGPEKGTGLGLYVIHGIAQQHNGWITIDSTPNEGTTFQVYFEVPLETDALLMNTAGKEESRTGAA